MRKNTTGIRFAPRNLGISQKKIESIGTKCTMEGCERRTARLTGLCAMHHMRKYYRISFKDKSKFSTPAATSLEEFERIVRKIEGYPKKKVL